MNGYIGQNTKNVDEFIERIRQRIVAAADNWKEIAAAFAEAKEAYGFDSNAFNKLCEATKFSKSKASKLATIASSERLKTYEKELAAVQAWTVLYDITTLTDEQFQRLLKNRTITVTGLDKPEIISSAMVSAARRNRGEKSTMRVYAQVSVDVEAVRAREIGGDNIEALEKAIRDIQISIPYVKVDKWDVFEDEDKKYDNALQRAFEAESRAVFKEEIRKKFKRYKKAPHESKEQYHNRVLGQSIKSVMTEFELDRVEAFNQYTDGYDEKYLRERAESRVRKNLSKIAERVRARGDGFDHAEAARAEIQEREEAEEQAWEDVKAQTAFRYRAINKDIFKEFK